MCLETNLDGIASPRPANIDSNESVGPHLQRGRAIGRAAAPIAVKGVIKGGKVK